MKFLTTTIMFISFNAIAIDGVKEQFINIKIQEQISAKILQLENINSSSVSLKEYIDNEQEVCISNAKNSIHLEDTCLINTSRMQKLGDLETIIDLDIAKLSEYQTSFIFSLAVIYSMGDASSLGQGLLFTALIPFSLAVDLAATPYIVFRLLALE